MRQKHVMVERQAVREHWWGLTFPQIRICKKLGIQPYADNVTDYLRMCRLFGRKPYPEAVRI